MKLRIKEEYRQLLRRLNEEESSLLEEQILQEGILHPIIHNSEGVIIDGMTRFEIAEKHGLEYPSRELVWKNEEHEQEWIIRHQLAKRNISRSESSRLRAMLYRSKKGSRGGDRKSKSHDETLIGDAAEQVAVETGVSRATVLRDAAQESLVEQLPEKIRELHLGQTCPLSETQMKVLIECPELSQIERALRVGQAETVGDAYQSVTGKKFKGVKNGKKKATPSESAAEDEEAAEETEMSADDRMATSNTGIESVCRALNQFFRERIEPLADDNAWMLVHGRLNTVKQTLATVNTTLRSCKGDRVCPKCDGEGCNLCHKAGWLDKATSQQIDS